MAKVNPVKLKQDADKEEKAGRIDRAIALYRQVVEDNPRDWNTIKKVGDLYARINKNSDAIAEWRKVAEFFAQDGFHLKSIAIWKQINKLDPAALEPYLNLADLYGKQGLMMEAKSQYQYVVDEYLKRGKNREAGDVLKKMADIDPGDLKVRSKLADLYTREGNTARAVDEHVAIAEELGRKGHLAEAMQVLEKGLKIDAKSPRIRVELARVNLVQKNYEKAARYLEDAVRQSPNDTTILARLGEAYLGAKKIEEAEAIFKRLLELDPGDEDSRVQMGRVFLLQRQFDRAFDEFQPVVDKLLGRRDGDRASALLQQIVQANPAHVKTLRKLVEIYQQFRKESAVLATYSQLTEAYIQQDEFPEAASVLEILVQREPHNAQHRSKLDFVKGRLGAPAPPPAAVEEEEFDLSPAPEAVPAPRAAPPPPAPAAPPRPPGPTPAPAPPGSSAAPPVRPTIEPAGPLSEEDKEFIEEHLAEGRVFRKYGLVDKATDQFEAVVARFPDNVEARQELRDIYREKGQAPKALAQCLALAEIFRLKGDEAAAAAQESEAHRLDPSYVPAAAPPPARPAAPPRAGAPVPAFVPMEDEAIALGPAAEAEAEEEISLDIDESAELAAAAPEEAPFDLGLEAEAEGELAPRFIDEEPPVPPAAEEATVPAVAEEAPALAEDLPAPAGEEEVPLFTAEEPAPAVEEEEPAFAIGLEDEAPLAPEPEAELPEPELAEAELAEADLPEPERPETLPEEPDFELPLADLEEVPAPLAAAETPGFDLALEEPARPAAEEEAEAPVVAPLTARPAAPVPAADSVPPDLARVFDEVESFVSLGFVDDARESLRAAAHRFGTHEAFVHKVAELGVDLGEEPAPPPEAPAEDLLGELDLEPALEEPVEAVPAAAPAPAPGGVDLGAELGDLFGAQAAVEEPEAPPTSGTEFGDAGLADIFKEFKAGVDKQLGKEDYDTRYNLGIAYKEMGLIDEAIAEFQLAAKDENRLLECSSMLGICFLEKGMPKLAVKWFEKGLKAPGRSEDEYSALRYDLAAAHEASGDTEKALSLYTDLYGQDANYRDVAAKVRELRG